MTKRERALPSALAALEVEFTAKAGVVVGESGGVVESRSPILGEKGKRLRQKPNNNNNNNNNHNNYNNEDKRKQLPRTKENSYRGQNQTATEDKRKQLTIKIESN